MRFRAMLIAGGLLSVLLGPASVRASEDGAVEPRGLNLPRVTVPAPPPSPPTMQLLNVRVVGEGQGKVTIPPAAACPLACSAQYPPGTPIILAAVPAPGSTFSGWSGDCRGTTPCTLRMDQPHTVEAKFNKVQAAAPTAPSFPNVTVAPSPGGPIPIPYPNIGGAALSPQLASISIMLANGTPAQTIMEAWKGYVTRQMESRQPLDVQATLNEVIGQAQAQLKSRVDADRKRLADKMNSVGDDAQLANVEMQNLLQKQQQTLQMMSNISKQMHDTAMAIIQNMK